MRSNRRTFNIFRALLPSMRVIRVATYATFAFCVLGLLGARVLYADVREATTSLGRTLNRLTDLTGDSNTIRMNGIAMHSASAFTEQSVGAVLDRFEQECSAHNGVLGKSITEVLKNPKTASAQPPGAFKLGIVRDEDEGGGMVVCFVDETSPDPHQLKERLEEFLKTSDISVFGNLRYVTATKIPDGGTRVRTMWTEDHVNLHAMFPADSDAPGADSQVMPRPTDAKRIVAAAVDGQPYSVRIYSSRAAENDLAEMYDREMPKRGFKRVEEGGDDSLPTGGAAYLREDGLMVFVSFAESEGATAVSLVEGGRGGAITNAVAAPEE